MLEFCVPLRVFHLVTSLNGGAGIAADRLARSQIESGTAAIVLGPKSGQRRTIKSVISKVITYLQMKMATRKYGIVTPV